MLDSEAPGLYIGPLFKEKIELATKKKKPVKKKIAKKSAKKTAKKKPVKKQRATRKVVKKSVTGKARKKGLSRETVKLTTPSEAHRLAHRIAQLMLEKKAEDVVIGDLNGLTSVTDCFVIGTATSDLHARAIGDHVVDTLARDNQRPHHREGQESLKWILIDYVDVVAHIFQRSAREYYDLERLWGDATFTPVTDAS
jgi:ribosome-associated protein